MSKNNHQVPDSIKRKIVKAFAEEQSTVRQLSEEYSISRTTIYKWIRQQNQITALKTKAKKVDNSSRTKSSSMSKSRASPLVPTSKPSFMELSISSEDPPQNNLSIKEIFIDFEDFSLSINTLVEGSFSKAKLVKILDIMGV